MKFTTTDGDDDDRSLDVKQLRLPNHPLASSTPPSFVNLTATMITVTSTPTAGSVLSAVVTLDSIEIFKTHEWLTKPTVYFQCKGENKTVLPDVKEKHVSYTFKGEESWQPLTDFPNEKCKRCGFYEKDIFKSDEFDEWEFCPSDFSKPDGRYTHLKDKEFNATFLCSECVPHELDSNSTSETHKRAKGMHWALVLTIRVSVSAVFVVGSVVAYKYWQKRKREQEHAQFLKLFEEVDDIEDELGLGPLDGIV